MLDLIAKFFLLFSQPEVLAVIFLTGFWYGNRRIWGVAIMLSAFSMMLNPALKEFFQMPRPGGAEGYGFPSGHFQGSMCFYGWLFVHTANIKIRVLLAILLAGIGFGLVQMGFHFPHDIAGSFVVGSLIILGATVLLNREPFYSRPHLMGCVLSGLGILPLIYMFFHTGIQKHSLVGLATLSAVTVVWSKFFPMKSSSST